MERRIRKVTQDTIDAFYPNLNLAAFYRKVAEEFQMPDTGLTARKYGLRLTYRSNGAGSLKRNMERRGVRRSICAYVCPARVWKSICRKMKWK